MIVPPLVIKTGSAEGVSVLLARALHLQTAWNGMRESNVLGGNDVACCICSPACQEGEDFTLCYLVDGDTEPSSLDPGIANEIGTRCF